jgi:gamma-glutamyl-gamma-aminobutyrate hydrolase PuuD
VTEAHPVVINKESRFAGFYDVKSVVNSYHECCVSRGGDDFSLQQEWTIFFK